MSAPRHAVVAIVVRDGRALYVRRSDAARAAVGYWTPVSGVIEPGEHPRDTVAREVREEVGLDVVAHEHVATLPTDDGRFVLHVWTCRDVRGEARACSVEVDALGWFTPAELRALRPVFDADVEHTLAVMATPGSPPVRGQRD